MNITFLLNGETVALTDVAPTATLLGWLRKRRALIGTKEGCNEGDCGACTVIVTDATGARPLNACILLLPQLHGKAVRTVEGISGPEGQLHPVQQAMIDHHGAQCGFCTPGFITAMAAAHLNGETDHATALAGNLCRCTGYVPILRAARAAASDPVPDWMLSDRAFFWTEISSGGAAGRGADSPPSTPAPAPPSDHRPEGLVPDAGAEAAPALPGSSDALAALLTAHPDTTLIAGATDVGLWITKALRTPHPVAFLDRCNDLRQIEQSEIHIRIGAAVTMDRIHALMAEHHPSYAELIRRYGAPQVRAAATIGGNIANGSPIGDNPPALIALGAVLHLRKGDARRVIPLEEFFIDYGKQDRAPGEFVEAITFPRQPDRLRCYKISKRIDQDISAVCGCFNITVADGTVIAARIAFGGMAGIPKRAAQVEAALTGRPWTAETVTAAQQAFAEDFTPLSDMRASAEYRLTVARNLLMRALHEDTGTPASVLEVRA